VIERLGAGSHAADIRQFEVAPAFAVDHIHRAGKD
jgi:hypothetical protein